MPEMNAAALLNYIRYGSARDRICHCVRLVHGYRRVISNVYRAHNVTAQGSYATEATTLLVNRLTHSDSHLLNGLCLR